MTDIVPADENIDPFENASEYLNDVNYRRLITLSNKFYLSKFSYDYKHSHQ